MPDAASTPDERFADGATLAKNLWSNGLRRDLIADRLARRGHEETTIDRILGTLPEGRPDNLMVRPPRVQGGRVVLIVLGLIVWGIGFVMLALSRAARGPEFVLVGLPFAIVGGVLIKAGRA